MYKIVEKRELTPVICMFKVEAPMIAASALPGQFLIVRSGENGERVPLTICDYNKETNLVTIVIQVIGHSSRKICSLKEGDYITDFAGPLGNPAKYVNWSDEELKGKRFLFIAGGLGIAPVYPQVKYLKSKGAFADVILGAKTASLLIMEDELKEYADNLYICTDDGSKGEKGLVTEKMKRLLKCEPGVDPAYDELVAIGPMIMMKFVTLAAKDSGLPLTVSLNTIMVDGTGMCGACRVSVGGRVKFACSDGPEFDAYQVDFDEALRRLGMYKEFEAAANARDAAADAAKTGNTTQSTSC